MKRIKTLGPCPKPRKLFEKSLTKNFNMNRALRGSGVYYCAFVGLLVFAFVLIWHIVVDDVFDAGVHAWQYMPERQAPLMQDGSVVAAGLLPQAERIDIASAQHVDTGLLWLVNHENPLPPGFTPQNLVTHQGIRLHHAAYIAYGQMLAAMNAEGGTYGLQLISAYRPYEYQRTLFDNKVRGLISQGHSGATAEDLATKSLQRPGSSEHQTGLALDVTVSGYLTQDFAATKAGQWLATNSYRFGFIIRYPQHKTEVTQIIYEPWHLRYVGIPHARIIWENGLTLEEYASFIASGPYIQWQGNNKSRSYFLVMYTEFWPESPLPNLINISSIRPGGRGGYILTHNKTTPDI